MPRRAPVHRPESQAMPPSDYDLLGPRGVAAVETGLATAEWYHTEVERKTMRDLMRRRDGPALVNTAIWLGTLVVTGIAVALLWPSWWALPPLLVYAVLYGSGGDARWHECGHGTAFKTDWMNQVVYHIASFMIVRNPVAWRWSHARHHTDTIIVGRDPEIAIMRPPDLAKLILNVFGIPDTLAGWATMLRNARGHLSDAEKSYVPPSEQPGIVSVARIWCAIYAACIALAVATGSWVPIVLVIFPKLFGSWHLILLGVLQHAGLAEDVLDHRMNTRTVYINPVSRFIYLNMNYHVEHHMFPMVPFHALPRLHALIKDDLPAPNPSILAAYREVWPVLRRQLRHETHFLRRALPPTARPYREDLHVAALGG